MSVLKVNATNYQEIKNSASPVLLDFYADWCGPCRMVGPIVEEIAAERSDVVVAKVNVDENPDLAGEYGVFSIPTLVVLKDGAVVKQVTGFRPKDQILALLEG
ncbi:MAG: thioredoxin [Clostridia bacterium]|nr:thioredoxin [Clostridia bacterium]